MGRLGRGRRFHGTSRVTNAYNPLITKLALAQQNARLAVSFVRLAVFCAIGQQPRSSESSSTELTRTRPRQSSPNSTVAWERRR